MLFLVISRPETATPQALEAFPGEKIISDPNNASIASIVVGMLAPSATPLNPFLMLKIYEINLTQNHINMK
mgnify:FL=1